jgi:serine/threonine protein kinase
MTSTIDQLVNIDLSIAECQEAVAMYEDIMSLTYNEAIEKYKEVGTGHYGEVYLMNNQKYVMKIFIDSNLENESNEMECQDPYILQDLQHIRVRGRAIFPSVHAYLPGKFMVMDYVEGIELEYQPFNDIALHESFWEIFFEGLLAIYKSGYMYKDLHSNNIMVTKEGLPMLIDVGAYYKHENKQGIEIPEVLQEREYRALQRDFLAFQKSHFSLS